MLTSQTYKKDASAKFVGELYSGKGLRAKQASSFSNPGSTDIYSMFWYYPAPDEKSVDFSATLEVKIAEEASLPLKAGAETKLGAYTIKIESVKEGSPRDGVVFVEGQPVKSWTVAYSVASPAGEAAPLLMGIPLDSKGEPIVAVDRSGNPAKPEKVASTTPQFVPPVFHHGPQKPPPTLWISRVKPDKVSQLKLHGTAKRKIAFTNVAMDPTK